MLCSAKQHNLNKWQRGLQAPEHEGCDVGCAFSLLFKQFLLGVDPDSERVPSQQGKLPTELVPLENYLEIGNGLPNRKKLTRGIIWAGNGN